MNATTKCGVQVDDGLNSLCAQCGELLIELQQRTLCIEYIELRAESCFVASHRNLISLVAGGAGHLHGADLRVQVLRIRQRIGDFTQRTCERAVVLRDGEVVLGVADFELILETALCEKRQRHRRSHLQQECLGAEEIGDVRRCKSRHAAQVDRRIERRLADINATRRRFNAPTCRDDIWAVTEQFTWQNTWNAKLARSTERWTLDL